MGASGGYGSGSSGTSESRLSNTQADILQERQGQYNEYFFPELINQLGEAKSGTMAKEIMASQAKGINQSSNSATRQLLAAAGQRGISGSGVELQGLAQIGSAKNSMLSDAYNQSLQAQRNQRLQLLQMGLNMSPTTTTAAPLNQDQDNRNWNFSGWTK